jgi:hypothetical protein
MSERLNAYKKMIAAAEAAGIGYCEDCGAGMTAVELPNGKFRAWIDHAADFPAALDAGVFVLTPPPVLPEYSSDEIAAKVAAAKAAALELSAALAVALTAACWYLNRPQ